MGYSLLTVFDFVRKAKHHMRFIAAKHSKKIAVLCREYLLLTYFFFFFDFRRINSSINNPANATNEMRRMP